MAWVGHRTSKHDLKIRVLQKGWTPSSFKFPPKRNTYPAIPKETKDQAHFEMIMGFWVGVSIRFVWHFLGRNHFHVHILSKNTYKLFWFKLYIQEFSLSKMVRENLKLHDIWGRRPAPGGFVLHGGCHGPYWAMGLPGFAAPVLGLWCLWMFMVWGLGLAMVFCKSPSASSKCSLRVRKFNPQNEGLAELFVLLGSAPASRAGFTINKTSELRENGHKLQPGKSHHKSHKVSLRWWLSHHL